jgi:hypothetical protein
MSSKNINPASLSAEERRLRSRLHQLLSRAEGFLHGSLIEMARRCGNPRCRCAASDANKHRSLYLGQTREGKSTMLYVPRDLEETVRRWSGNFQEAADLLEALNRQGRNRISETKTKAGAAKKIARKKPPAKKPPAKKTTLKPPSRPS